MFSNIWQIVAGATLVVTLVILSYALWLRGENVQLQNEIEARDLAIELATKELDRKQVEANKTITKIKTVYKDRKVYVETFVKDENETDCAATSRFWDGYQFPSLHE